MTDALHTPTEEDIPPTRTPPTHSRHGGAGVTADTDALVNAHNVVDARTKPTPDDLLALATAWKMRELEYDAFIQHRRARSGSGNAHLTTAEERKEYRLRRRIDDALDDLSEALDYYVAEAPTAAP